MKGYKIHMEQSLKTKHSIQIKQLVLCALFTALTAVGAFLKIPFFIVPTTCQFFFVAMASVLLGPKLALFSQLGYLIIGLAGVPIFTKGGGFWYIFEPTFGYLIGFCVASFIIGKIVEKAKKQSFLITFMACLAGLVIVYTLGVSYMYYILNFYLKSPISVWAAIGSGAAIFLPADIAWCAAIAFLSKKIKPAIKRYL